MAAQRQAQDRSSDTELLAAIASRDGAAFSIFYRRHLPAVLAYLMRETGDPEAAGDLAAEVFAAVLLAAGRYRAQRASAAPWVIGIARNKLLMSFRRGRIEARARRRLGYEPVAFEADDFARIEAVADRGAGQLSRLLGLLPADERHAVHSRVIKERSYSEIAAELQCSEMVVRKRVSRGLARVREQFEKAEQDG
ncbi:MAG TPA: RNA polymerase sigma factor [Solirubrobacteraceae bacterium]